jgi:arylsulfatase A-like enzyme
LVQLPQLREFAEDATTFTKHFANCVPCAPSRASIHTGLYQFTHRVLINGNPVDARFTDWAQELRNAGRDPVLFGYTDTAVDPRTRLEHDRKGYEGVLPSLRQMVECNGATSPESENPESVADWISWITSKGHMPPSNSADLRRKTVDGDKVEVSQQAKHPLPLEHPAELSDTAFVVEETAKYIQSCADEEWTIHMSLFRPHPPFFASAPYTDLYDMDELPGYKRAPTIEEEAAMHPFVSWALEKYPAPTGEELRQHHASYYAMISEVDSQLGRLFSMLKESGQWDDTLVIFTSDHGEQMGDHHLKQKTGFFEQSYHIPLIIRDPRPDGRNSRGVKIDGFTESVDLMPTLLDFAGVKIPTQCDGFSLIRAVHQGSLTRGWRHEAFYEYTFWDDIDMVMDTAAEEDIARKYGLAPHQCSLSVVRSAEYKYVHFAATFPPLLYDLIADPEELHNLAEDPNYASVVADMAGRMLSRRLNHAERFAPQIVVTPTAVVQRQMPLSLLQRDY